MFYEHDLTIPANTSRDAPAELEVVLCAGVIKQVEVQLPYGLRGLVHTVALRGIHQVWPSNPDGSIKGQDARIVWGEQYELREPPYTMILRGWSAGTSYPHVVTWRFNVISLPAPEPKPPTSLWSVLRGWTIGCVG